MAALSTAHRPPAAKAPASSIPTARSIKTRKDIQPARAEIWTSLLRQTREAQARSRTSALHQRSLILCGGSPGDQHQFVQSLARPPPQTAANTTAPSRLRDREREQQRRQREERDRRGKGRGEWRLSNRYAYGYGHVTLYSPVGQQGAALLGVEAEEAARLEVHTLLEPEEGYESVLRRLLRREAGGEGGGEESGALPQTEQNPTDGAESQRRNPTAVALLLSWREPWRFLHLLRAWLLLLARALQPASSPTSTHPLHILQQHHLALTVVIQHVEAQELLEREGYTEESFDYIASSLRTCLLPLSAALLYTVSSPPPLPPGAPLSEVQKVLFTALDLPLSALAPAPVKPSVGAAAAGKKEDLAPRHNVVDRMAVVVPSGWDSAGKIRLLSETFSPEAVLEAWTHDLDTTARVLLPSTAPAADHLQSSTPTADSPPEQPTTIYATTSPTGSDPSLESRHPSPSRAHPIAPLSSPSAISTYESQILNPSAHKILPPPSPTTTTLSTQTFLAEIRQHLLELEAQDPAAQNPRTTGLIAGRGLPTGAGAAHGVQLSSSAATATTDANTSAGALNELLGNVSFNVGGVSYDTVSAGRALDALLQKDGQRASEADEERYKPGLTNANSAAATAGGNASATGPGSGITTPRSSTPLRRAAAARRGEDSATTGFDASRLDRESSSSTLGGSGGGSGLGKSGDLPVEKLEEYFASLMKKGSGGGGSGNSTPSRVANGAAR